MDEDVDEGIDDEDIEEEGLSEEAGSDLDEEDLEDEWGGIDEESVGDGGDPTSEPLTATQGGMYYALRTDEQR